MDALAARLDACQDKLIDLYEKDSNKLEDQLLHWQYTRLEKAMLFKARETGLTHIGHQVVPPLSVTKEKARQAITVHLSLQSLNNSEFRHEPWTLQDTSLDMWNVSPKGCWKKQGRPIRVKYDGEDDKEMEYVSWGYIYIQCASTDTWLKVPGQISHQGLYYELEGCKRYYVDFAKEAKHYGAKNMWEVHVGSTIIYHTCESVSSTQGGVSEVSTAATAAKLYHTTTAPTPTATKKAPQVQAPPVKRQRLGGDCTQQPDSTQDKRPFVDSCYTRTNNNPNNTQWTRDNCISNGAPVLHLKGDPNRLKCFRYRLQQSVPQLFDKASSTWRWTCGGTDEKYSFVTLWYKDTEQRTQFLARVNIPKGIVATQGHMSMCV
uniref:Regulatory protein E2 n=1 Tax=human papillomavirus 87 TaxID=120381 RepID=A0A7G2A492_9PAPI|nr:putative E2 protein [human papillomavirus 87]